MNINGTVSTAPSEVLETFADKFLATEENGIKVDYTDIEKTYIESSIYKDSCYVFSVEENLFKTMIAEINVNLPCEIQYAEIEVINR